MDKGTRNGPALGGHDLQGLRIAVTGARGFIGRRIVAALTAGGADVTALLRSGHDASQLGRLGARVAVAPLRAGPALDRALAGQQVLVHAAYDVRADRTANLAAFDALLEAARAAGIRRIVHLSSVVVYDDWPQGPIDETRPCSSPGGGDYRQAKIAMENQLMQGDHEVAILQPTIVYGPGSALWTEAPMAALRSGGVVLPEPCGRCPAVYVDDVARAVVLAARMPGLERERFVISGADNPGWADVYTGYRDIVGGGDIQFRPAEDILARLGPRDPAGSSGGPSVAARLSAGLRRVFGSRRFDRVMASLRRAGRRAGPVWPDRSMLALLTSDPKVSIARAQDRLGYRPAFDLAAGLAEIRAAMR